MRRKLLFVISTFVLSLITTSQALAQDSRWTGASLSDIAGGKQGYFYLYNVGKKMFLSQGGLWGTGTEVSASGLQMQALEPAGSGKYYVKTNLQMEGVNTGTAGYLNFADGKNITNDTGHFFLDQGKFTCGRWTITAVSKNVYTLKVDITEGTEYKGKTYYLSAESSSMNVVPTTSGNGEYSQWMFVTLKEIKADFLKADDASISNPTPSSFFFSDPGFYRSDLGITSWTITSSPKALSTSTTNKPLSSDGSVVSCDDNILPINAISSQTTTYTYSLKCYYYRSSAQITTKSHTVSISSKVPLHNLTTDDSSVTLNDKDDFIDCGMTHPYGIASQVLTLISTTSGQKGYTYYIGNGYILDGNGGSNLDSDLNASVNNWQSPYGKDWTANIHGQSGIIQQTISSNTEEWAPGWYKIICKGFSTDGTGKLFAYSGTTPNTDNTDKYQTATFITPESIPTTYVKASRLINDGTSAFEQSVTVYVGQGESLTFGVEVKGGSASSWTCFDSFALSYCGKGELNLIIDEGQTSIDYLNQQVNTEKNQTLRLKRNLNPGKWNSLVLPVTLNAGQVKTAFGTTKLAKLNGADKNRIYFELVNLDDDAATAIEAGKLYIINPQNKMPTDQTEKHHSVEVPKPNIRDYYTINQVTFNEELTESRKEDKLWDGATSDGGMMRMVGTYVALTKTDNGNPIPANSYVLSGGKWMFATKGVNSVLGLRGWIETGIGNTSKSLIFNIDGVDEEEVSTGIDGLFVNGAETNTSISKTGVYSLSGQKISDKTNLPKGIYIVNGRKMIVK